MGPEVGPEVGPQVGLDVGPDVGPLVGRYVGLGVTGFCDGSAMGVDWDGKGDGLVGTVVDGVSGEFVGIIGDTDGLCGKLVGIEAG